MRMNLNKALGLTALVLAVIFVIHLAVMVNQKPGVRYVASWANRPQTINDAEKLADQIIVGRVQRVKRADDLVINAPGEPGNTVRTPVEYVTVQLEKTCKGSKPDRLEVFHTGLSAGGKALKDRSQPSGQPTEPPNQQELTGKPQGRQPSEDESRTISLDDDPPYESGKRVVLFLMDGPELTDGGSRIKTKAVISPEGRYEIEADGKVKPATKHSFAAQFAGKKQEELERAIGNCR